MIVGWIAWLSTIITGILVSIAARKTHKYGVDQSGPLAGGAHHHDESSRERSLAENDSGLMTTTTAEKGTVHHAEKGAAPQHVDHDHQWQRAQ